MDNQLTKVTSKIIYEQTVFDEYALMYLISYIQTLVLFPDTL